MLERYHSKNQKLLSSYEFALICRFLSTHVFLYDSDYISSLPNHDFHFLSNGNEYMCNHPTHGPHFLLFYTKRKGSRPIGDSRFFLNGNECIYNHSNHASYLS